METIEEVIADAISHVSIWQEMLFIFFFLIITGGIACFVSLYIVQWVSKITFGPDPNDQRKKDERAD